MPKPTKTQTKAKLKEKSKLKRKNEPERASITTKKSYWVMLTLVIAIVVAVCAYALNFSLLNNALLVATIAFAVAFMGYIRVSPSTLSLSKRATFLFVGASIIGFSIWAAIVLILNATGLMLQIANAIGDQFFIIPSLITCLIFGALIGELLGRNSKVQAYLFKPK
jgi:cation transport ATPase